MILKTKLKRFLVKKMLINRKTHLSKLNNEQQYVYSIAKKLISFNDSTIEFSPNTEIFYVKNGLKLIFDGNNSQNIEWYSGLGTFAGSIQPNSSGHLVINSSFGVRLGTDILGDAITITPRDLFNHNVSFNNSLISNIRELKELGIIKFRYTTHSLSTSDQIYVLSNDCTIAVLTSVAVNAKINCILTSGSNPVNGEVKIITNAGSNIVYLVTTDTVDYNSNIKVTPNLTNGNFDLDPNSSIMLIYYDGYWRIQTDKGQQV